MAKSNYVLESFTNFLCDNLEGFDQLSWMHQFNFADLALTLDQKWRKHSLYDGYSIRYEEVREKFGRNFKSMNDSLGIFNVSPNWSKDNGWTRAYSLSYKMTNIRTAFLASDPMLSELIDEKGRKLRTLPENGIETEVNCRNEKNTIVKATVTINHTELLKCINGLKSMETMYDVSLELESARKINHYSHTVPGGPWQLIQRYSESRAGRLYAKKINLQNAPNLVVDAALSGCYEYDFANCHFALFTQLAMRIDIQCAAIDNYTSNKQCVRQQISSDVGLTINQTKECLIALMYGARTTTWHENAIPVIAGTKAPALYKHPLFMGIADDIKKARPEIIRQWPDTSQRSIINAMDKPISKKQDDRFIMAHIQQGLEARMLHIAINLYGDQIALLKHDGFSTYSSIDIQPVIEKIRSDLGLEMVLSEEIHGGQKAHQHTQPTTGGRYGEHMTQILTDRKRQKNSGSPIVHAVK